MTNDLVYLDHQATTPCDPRVLAAMLPWFTDSFANPHSVEHEMGRAAAAAVEQARAQVAALIGAEPREIVFTSGATEANNLAIKGAARHALAYGDPARRRIITTAAEHDCVLEATRSLAAEGFDPIILPVGPDGLLNPDHLREALATPTLLVSVMSVNNETGVIETIPTLAALARAAGALFHTDAAQAAGRIPLDVAPIDLLSLSGHKIYGPKGIGALYVRHRPRTRLAPLFSGGGQERGLRAGTLPTPLIIGLGAACALAAAEMDTDTARIAALRDQLLAELRAGIPGLRVNGSLTHRIAGNLNLTFPAASAADLMAALPWLCVSTGSACSSATLAPSHVLRAMGLPDAQAARSLRLGLGRTTSQAEITRVAAALIQTHATLAGARAPSGGAACPR
jgi:cysteine desulfurase